MTIRPLTALITGLILLYRWTLSPVLPASCRYHPSCSAYALEAVRRHGAVPGAWLAARRLLRCHPWGDSGDDPVPDAPPWRAHRLPKADEAMTPSLSSTPGTTGR